MSLIRSSARDSEQSRASAEKKNSFHSQGYENLSFVLFKQRTVSKFNVRTISNNKLKNEKYTMQCRIEV
jgi:hypothetical protein